MEEDNYYLGKYWISFYGDDDETFLMGFNNLEDICKYKHLEVNRTNINTLKIGIWRALKRPMHKTKMLDRYGKEMHLYLIDMTDDE